MSRSLAPYPALGLFAAALAYLEAAAVVYLRELYVPAGLQFPLQPFPASMVAIELGREAAAVVLIGWAATLCGRGLRERFGLFAFVFGAWDILYYAWLKVLIGWPEGLLDPDILFLIPSPWVGPVLAPVLVSVVLMVLGTVLRPPGASPAPPLRLGWADAALFGAGAALVLWSFLRSNLGASPARSAVLYPPRFDWACFLAGWALGAAATLRLARRARRPDS